MDKEEKFDRISLHKKFWYSMTKFEKYPEMAAEGVGRAIGYLAWLMFLFAIIIGIGLTIKFHGIAKNIVTFVENNFSEINYEDGFLTVQTKNNNVNTEMGNVIINTDELTLEEEKNYENNISTKPEFIWLKNRVIAKYNSNQITYYYKDILGGLGFDQFNKTEIINYLDKQISSPTLYIIYFTAMLIYTFLAYFISTLFDIFILSIFGMITSLIAKIKIRYRAVFNMSVYAVTISVILQAIYIYIRIFTNFNIKYFDLMYTTISFICLAAAIFMIKSDVIKQQLELMKIIEVRKQESEEQTKEENKEEDTEEDKEKEENKEKEKNEKKNDEKLNDNDAEGQGSNA